MYDLIIKNCSVMMPDFFNKERAGYFNSGFFYSEDYRYR